MIIPLLKTRGTKPGVWSLQKAELSDGTPSSKPLDFAYYRELLERSRVQVGFFGHDLKRFRRESFGCRKMDRKGDLIVVVGENETSGCGCRSAYGVSMGFRIVGLCESDVIFLSPQKEGFEQQVQRSMDTIVPIILEHLGDDGSSPVEVAVLKNATSTTQYVFNEALGRLKAVGFISDRKRYVKARREKRTDGKESYYEVDVDRQPCRLSSAEMDKELIKRRQRLDKIKETEAKITALMWLDD